MANNPLALTTKALILLEDRIERPSWLRPACPARSSTAPRTMSGHLNSSPAWPGLFGRWKSALNTPAIPPLQVEPGATAAALTGVWRRLGGLEPGRSGYTQRMTVRAALTAGTAAPGDARRLVADKVAEWGLDDIGDDLRLIASELVTNALIHTLDPWRSACQQVLTTSGLK